MTPSLGEKIRMLRQEKGLSQVLLEKKSGVNSKLLSKYENGKIIPTADTLKKIAQGLETSADYLIFDNVPKHGLSQIQDLDLFEKFKAHDQNKTSHMVCLFIRLLRCVNGYIFQYAPIATP